MPLEVETVDYHDWPKPGEQRRQDKRWNEAQKRPQESSAILGQRADLYALATSPAWQRVKAIRDQIVGLYKVPIPVRAEDDAPYRTYCVVRDVLDKFLEELEIDAQKAPVIKEDQLV